MRTVNRHLLLVLLDSLLEDWFRNSHALVVLSALFLMIKRYRLDHTCICNINIDFTVVIKDLLQGILNLLSVGH